MATKAKVLSKNQFGILGGLIEHRGWQRNCGWHWNGQGRTERICKTLVNKGLAKETPATNDAKTVTMLYEVTALGKSVYNDEALLRYLASVAKRAFEDAASNMRDVTDDENVWLLIAQRVQEAAIPTEEDPEP